jgi:hypothetical protein
MPAEPELKAVDCSDHDPIEEWAPDEGPFIYWLALHIGPKGEQGADLFYVPVANSTGLESAEWSGRSPDNSPVPIVLEDYSWKAVLGKVQQVLNQCPKVVGTRLENGSHVISIGSLRGMMRLDNQLMNPISVSRAG